MGIKVRSRGELNGKNYPSFDGNHWLGPNGASPAAFFSAHSCLGNDDDDAAPVIIDRADTTSTLASSATYP